MALDIGSDFDEIVFTVGYCPACDQRVLTHPDFSEESAPSALCVHCDGPVVDDLRSSSGADLPDHGYGLLESQGCGNPECGGGACSRLRDGQPE